MQYFNDFYLPSLDDLLLMYQNVDSTGGFIGNIYWSSSEYWNAPYLNAQGVDFTDGSVYTNIPKGNYNAYRAARQFVFATGYFGIADFGQCGYIFNIVDNGDGTSTYYECAKVTGQGSNVWSNVTIGGAGTYTTIGTGKANSDHIIAQYGHVNSAAKDCENLSLTGRTLNFPPTGLTYAYTYPSANFSLSWHGNFVAGLSHYAIEYYSGLTWNFYGTTSSGTTTATITAHLQRGLPYRVAAVDTDNVYWWSNPIICWCLIPPNGVTITNEYCNHFEVDWTNNNSPDIYTNIVQTYYSSAWHDLTIVGSGVTSCAVYTAPGTSTPVRVGVISLTDSSRQYSTAVTGTTLTVSNPSTLTGVMSGLNVQLNWINTSSNGQGIAVWRTHNAIPTQVATLPTSATSYLDTGTTQGETYTYSIAAYCGVYNYWSNSITITTTIAFVPAKPLISDIYFIRFNDQALFDVVLEDFEIHFQLADLKNLSQAKTSFTIPIRIPYTPHSRAVFGSLFNINSQNLITDIKVDCKLYYRDKVIIDGYSYVYFSTPDYINIIIARNDISIFEDVGDRTLDKLAFTGNSYTYRNDYIKEMVQYAGNGNLDTGPTINPFSANTTFDRQFVMIDWWNAGNTRIPNNSQYNNSMYTNSLFQNYPLSPVVRVKTIFDRIFSDNGYTYTASTTFMDKIDRLYMTTTVPISNYTQDVKSNWLFSGTTNYGASSAKNLFRTAGHGHWFIGMSNFENYTGNTSMGNVINNAGFNASNSLYCQLPFFAGQECTVTLGLYGVPDGTASGSTDVEIHTCTFSSINPLVLDTVGDAILTFPTVIFNIPGNTAHYYEVSTTFTPPDNWDMSQYLMVTIVQNNAISLSRTKQAGYREAGITVTTPNYLYYTGNTYTLQDLMPNNYKQFDFLNDLLTATNMYIWADIDNNKLLHLEDSADFNTQNTLDWSKKFSLDNFEIYDTSQQIYNQYTLGTKESDDKISKSYSNYNNINLNEKVLNNTNQLAINEPQDIRLSQPQGVLTFGLATTNANLFESNSSISKFGQLPIFTYYDKPNSACLFGYINKFLTVSIPPYTTNSWDQQFIIYNNFGEATYPGNFCVYGNYVDTKIDVEYQTFSPFRLSGNTKCGWNPYTGTMTTNINLQEICDSNTFAWLFDSNDTYLNLITGNTITNNNLYFNFWEQDMESKLFSNQKFVKSYIRLRENDLAITNFKKKIFISNSKIGDAYYRLNKIVFPSDYKKLAYVEMTTDLNYIPKYESSVYINVLGYDANTDSTYFIRNGGIIPPGPPPPPVGIFSNLYVTYQNNVGIHISGTSGISHTYSLQIIYSAEVDCQSAGGGHYSTISGWLFYSLDNGNTWIQITNVSCQSSGSYATDYKSNMFWISNVTDISKVRFWGDYNFSGNGVFNSNWDIRYVHINYENGGLGYVVCPGHAHGGSNNYTPILNCT